MQQRLKQYQAATEMLHTNCTEDRHVQLAMISFLEPSFSRRSMKSSNESFGNNRWAQCSSRDISSFRSSACSDLENKQFWWFNLSASASVLLPWALHLKKL